MTVLVSRQPLSCLYKTKFTYFVKKIEKRANIKCCFELEKITAKTLKFPGTVYGGEALKKTAVYD